MVTKLLIVDDEPYTVDMLQTFLQINGFETVGALSGEDGLVLVKVEQPQIVILDLMLPDIEGYEVCERIRNYPETAGLPVLVLSARAEAASKERALAAGADAYMVKPVQFPKLLSEINRLLMTGHPLAPKPEEVKPTEPAEPKPTSAQPTDSATTATTPEVKPAETPTPTVPATNVAPTTPEAPHNGDSTTAPSPSVPTSQPTMPTDGKIEINPDSSNGKH